MRRTVVQLNVTVAMSLLVCFGNHVVVVEVGEVFVVVPDPEEVFLLPKEYGLEFILFLFEVCGDEFVHEVVESETSLGLGNVHACGFIEDVVGVAGGVGVDVVCRAVEHAVLCLYLGMTLGESVHDDVVALACRHVDVRRFESDCAADFVVGLVCERGFDDGHLEHVVKYVLFSFFLLVFFHGIVFVLNCYMNHVCLRMQRYEVFSGLANLIS